MNDAEELVRIWFADARRSGAKRLPAERVLAADLGLSRAALRKGLAALDADGVLSRQVGRGTFLTDPAPLEAMRPEEDVSPNRVVSEASPRHVILARLTLEPKLARLAAREASARDLATLRETEDAAGAASDWVSFDAADAAFHRAIAATTHNPVLLHLFDSLGSMREALDWGRLRDRPTFSTGATRAGIEHHGRIRAAIAERDSDAAETALAHHLMVESATIVGSLV